MARTQISCGGYDRQVLGVTVNKLQKRSQTADNVHSFSLGVRDSVAMETSYPAICKLSAMFRCRFTRYMTPNRTCTLPGMFHCQFATRVTPHQACTLLAMCQCRFATCMAITKAIHCLQCSTVSLRHVWLIMKPVHRVQCSTFDLWGVPALLWELSLKGRIPAVTMVWVDW